MYGMFSSLNDPYAVCASTYALIYPLYTYPYRQQCHQDVSNNNMHIHRANRSKNNIHMHRANCTKNIMYIHGVNCREYYLIYSTLCAHLELISCD